MIVNIIYPLSASLILYTILIFIHYVYEAKQKEALNTKLMDEMKNRHELIEKEVVQKTKDLQKAVNEKTTLLRELHHRVKNNLQLILSITRLQQHTIRDDKVKEEFGKLQNRINSIAKTHEILCDSDDISNVDMEEYIGQLCEEVENSIMTDDIEIVLDIKTTTLPLRQAVYLGLVINELMSNSLKYAFDSSGGKIFITFCKIDDECILKIGDSGRGYNKDEVKNSSLGLKLVDSLVLTQLDGQMGLTSDSAFEHTIKFKVSDV